MLSCNNDNNNLVRIPSLSWLGTGFLDRSPYFLRPHTAITKMKITNCKELAHYLGCTTPTVSRWVGQGLPYKFSTGILYEFDLEQVLKWLERKSDRHARWVADIRQKQK